MENMNFGSYSELWGMPSSTIHHLYSLVEDVVEERIKELNKKNKK